MCGIAGYAGPRPPDETATAAALRALARRGPDGRGARRFDDGDRGTVLAHARLAIIDLDERAGQPFFRDGLWLTYNGELFNYLELRRDLEREGSRFVTRSDTEVLLAAIARWGWEGLDRCEGMWAFAVYDTADGSLTLCRDRFGEKPLHLWRADDGVYFASEVKALAALAGRRPAVDVGHVLRYLVNGYKALGKERQGYFHGVRQLEPGTALRIDRRGRETSWRYWTPRCETEPDMSYDQAVAGVRERLIESVRLRLRADAPAAFCMSGGVDSNALIAIARRALGADVHGFTIVNTDARYEEGPYVRRSVAELALRHTEVVPTRDGAAERLREITVAHDAPVGTLSYYAHWLLMAAMSDAGYRISISGTAADELFTGYFDHHNAYLHDIRDDPAGFAAALADWRARVAPIVRNPYLRDPLLFVRRPEERRHVYLDADRFAARLRRPWSEPFAEARYAPELLRNRMLNELLHEVVPVILHEDDLNAMRHSIENRSPFLDRNLMEFAQRIPTRHLIRGGMTKAVLRDAVRGIAPDAIVDNPRKVGFNLPFEDLFDPTDPDARRKILADGPIYDLVDRDRVAALLESGPLDNGVSKFLFSVVSAGFFLEEFT